MRRPSRAGLSLVFALCVNIPLAAQNLESLGKEKPFSFAGGLSINQIFYSSSGITSRRDPYRYFASGNANLSFFGWTIPLAFSVANKQTSFSQPFNQYSLHPTWKWITAHAGYTSMSFSPYTVNGHTFLGAGVDIAPQGKWKVSALYGRFLKAVEADTTHVPSPRPSFQRTGYALKATWGTGRNYVDVILFHAGDDLHSIRNLPDAPGITPEQNLVMSVGGGKTVFEHLFLKAELASSAITKDIRAEKTTHTHPLAKAGMFFQPTLSSSYYNAFKTSLDFQQHAWVIGFAYERIDPGYRTLGAYYFNNDLENITINGSTGFLQGKLNVAASGGLQHDNLGKTKISTLRRMVGSLNAHYTPTQRLNLSVSYSGFQTFTNIRSQFETINQLTPYENLDTLNFTQISRNASLSGMYLLAESENKKQSINFNLTWQEAADQQGGREQASGTRFYNLNTAYTFNFVPENMTFAASINGTLNAGALLHTKTWGPTAAISRAFANRKIRTILSSSYNKTSGTGVPLAGTFNCRLNCAVAAGKKHHVTLGTVMIKRKSITNSMKKNIVEFTGTLGYRYQIGK